MWHSDGRLLFQSICWVTALNVLLDERHSAQKGEGGEAQHLSTFCFSPDPLPAQKLTKTDML